MHQMPPPPHHETSVEVIREHAEDSWAMAARWFLPARTQDLLGMLAARPSATEARGLREGQC